MPAPSIPSAYVTLAEATRRTKRSYTVLYRLVQKGEIPTFKARNNPRLLLVRMEDVEAALAVDPRVYAN